MFKKSLIFIVIVIVIVLTLSGCSFKTHYAPMEKSGVEQMQALKDSHECKMEAASYRANLAGGGAGGPIGAGSYNAASGTGTAFIGPGPSVRMAREATEQSEEFYVECMMLRGYKLSNKKASSQELKYGAPVQ